MSLYYRKKYEEKVNFLLQGSRDKADRFANKYIDSLEPFINTELEEDVNRKR